MNKKIYKIFTIIFVFLFLNSNLTVITSSTQDKNNSQNKLLAANSSGNSWGKWWWSWWNWGNSWWKWWNSSWKSWDNSNSKWWSNSWNKSASDSKSANWNNSKTWPAWETWKKATWTEMEVDSHTQATTWHFDREWNFVWKWKWGYDKDGNKLSKDSWSDWKWWWEKISSETKSWEKKSKMLSWQYSAEGWYITSDNPIINNWSWNWWTCAEYVDSWKQKLSPCKIKWDWYNSTYNPVVICEQIFDWEPKNTSNCWSSFTDSDWNQYCDISSCPKPKKPEVKKKDSIVNLIFSKQNDCSSIYANWKQECNLKFELKMSNFPKEWLEWFEWLKIKNFSYDWALSDQVELIWSDYLLRVNDTEIKDNVAETAATSVVPFNDIQKIMKFEIQGENNFTKVELKNISLKMKEPLELSKIKIDPNWIKKFFRKIKEWLGIVAKDNDNKVKKDDKDEKPVLWKEQWYNIEVNEKAEWLFNWVKTKDFFLDLKEKHVVIEPPHGVVKRKFYEKPLHFNKPNVTLENIFSQILDLDEEDKEKILNPAVVKVIPVPLSYKIKDKDGNFKLVRYYVKWIEPDASYWLVVKISWCRGKTTLWAKINWSVKDEWKWSKLWLVKNYTDLSSDLVRKNIHKNALDLIRNREDSKWKKLNKVYYNDKTTKYSDIRNQLEKWDTVIIKNANFIINDDIRKKIGIIVLKDNYKIEPQTLDWWNIFIGKYTEKINAYIYADWAIMSKNEKWEEYEDYDLATPLEINWSVFSRNTIGWAVAWISEGNFYILPGGEKTKDFKLAEQYDLNYIRKAPLCKEEDFSLKINYDPEIQINPPKWFSETK